MRRFAVVLMLAICALVSSVEVAGAQSPGKAITVLNREQASAILPPSVFTAGERFDSGRNSGGLKLPDGKLVLFTMVDTSGYSSSVQETYQAYLLTEVPLTIGGQALPPGAYGFGFIAGDKMVVMDIGSNKVLSAATIHDESLKRPTPLQVLPDTPGGTYRLYVGRSYVTVSPAAR